jgi:Ca2+-binding RTX toxin-like protein
MHRAPLLAILLVLVTPSAAFAGTAVLTETTNAVGGRDSLVTYSALPGERNVITMTRGSTAGTFEQVTIRDDGALVVPGAGCTPLDPNMVRCAAQPYVNNGFEQQSTPAVVLDAGDADDVVRTGRGYSTSSVYALGGAGADVVTGGGNLDGGPGDDVVTSTSETGEVCEKGCGTPTDIVAGGPGNDRLRGGAGNDLLIGDGDSATSPDPGGGNDDIDGGPGSDAVNYQQRRAPLRIDLAGGPSGAAGELDRVAGIESVTGGSGPDVLLGDDGPNVLDGGAGDDTLDGRGGNDLLDGRDGADILLGRAGNDELAGGQGNDVLYGGPGDDVLSSPIGAPSPLHCGSGHDDVNAPQGQLLSGCERVRLGDLWVQGPRRLRNGRLRTVLECRAGMRCEFVVKVRRQSAALVRRSITIPSGRARTVDLRPRARVRAGQEVDVAISGRLVVSEGTNGGFPTAGSNPLGGRWRVRLR